jgi:hypothetical protein
VAAKKPRGRPRKPPVEIGVRRTLSEEQRLAMSLELKSRLSGKTLTAGQLQRILSSHGVKRSRQTITNWQKDPYYGQGIDHLISDVIRDRLNKSDK